jgi:hypothetical protein
MMASGTSTVIYCDSFVFMPFLEAGRTIWVHSSVVAHMLPGFLPYVLLFSLQRKKTVMLCITAFFCLKVLQELPEGLAIAVLAASPATLEHHISTLPASLHSLVIEAAIRRKNSLTLHFSNRKNLNTAETVLHAATVGTTGLSALKKLEFYAIPVSCKDRLKQFMSSTCSSASDMHLTFGEIEWQLAPSSPPFSQLEECLSRNTALTSLQLSFADDPWRVFEFDCLFQSLTGLQNLELKARMYSSHELYPHNLHTPRGIVNLSFLMRLLLGPGLHLRDLPQVLLNMPRLQALCLLGEKLEIQASRALSSLTSLKTLELRLCRHYEVLPSVAPLTALQTHDLSGCNILMQLPPLDALTALLTLKLGVCSNVHQLPPLHNLTALKSLHVCSRDLL